MRPLREIYDEHHDQETDNVDLDAVNEEIQAGLETSGIVLTPIDQLAVIEKFVDTMFDYVVSMLLEVTSELGVLPDGYDVEYNRFQGFKAHAKMASVYEIVTLKRQVLDEQTAAPQLIVPQAQVPTDLRGEEDGA